MAVELSCNALVLINTVHLYSG